MSKHTIVIDFTGLQEPAYSAGMEVLGGKVVAVAFADEMERAEQLEQQAEDLVGALELMLSVLDPHDYPDEQAYARSAIERARGEE